MQLGITEGCTIEGLALLKYLSQAALTCVYRNKGEISIKMATKYQAKKMASQMVESGCMDSGGASAIDISRYV
jgi:hypothetical protein